MAKGRPPKPTWLKVIAGNPGKRALPTGEPVPVGPAIKPAYVRGLAAKIWERDIAPASWLTWADSCAAAQWCVLSAEFEKSHGTRMRASRISILRGLGGDLGIGPSARARLGVALPKLAPDDPANEYF